MPELVLGPLLRYVGETDATIWVETDGPCEVEVLGARTATFRVGAHHYGLVHVTGLEPDTERSYDVRLDGDLVWPETGAPKSVIRTFGRCDVVRLAFGSCRVALPHAPPHGLEKHEHDEGHGVDALVATARRMRDLDHDAWPTALLLLGDQIYADDISPGTADFIASRRRPEDPPGGDQVADFEEYTHLYYDSWHDPEVRWLLSTVPTMMIFDDHDVNDDWNISASWVEDMRATDWWDERIIGGFVSYWIYQHLGNLAPAELEADELFAQVRAADDAMGILREFAWEADRHNERNQWSFSRDFGRTRLIVVDSRAGRDLTPGARRMVDANEWRWIDSQATGDVDHLIFASSLPMIMLPALHHLEAWNEAVCDGAWGRLGSRIGETIRRTVDLEHWPAFGASFNALAGLIEEIAAGRRGGPPASILLLGGDVHHSYLARIGFRPGSEARTPVHQVVCSPMRNPLGATERMIFKLAGTRTMHRIARTIAHRAGTSDPPIGWRFEGDPIFDNAISTLEFEGRHTRYRHERATLLDGHAHLDVVSERDLSVPGDMRTPVGASADGG